MEEQKQEVAFHVLAGNLAGLGLASAFLLVHGRPEA